MVEILRSPVEVDSFFPTISAVLAPSQVAINRISAINSIFSYRIPKGVSSIHGGNSNIWLEFHPDPSGKIRPILSNIFVKWVGSTTNYCRSFFQGRAVKLRGCVKLSDIEFAGMLRSYRCGFFGRKSGKSHH